MRARNQDDWLEALLLTWGGFAPDIRKMQDRAASVLAKERERSEDMKSQRNPGEHSDPTLANVAALTSGQWHQLYTLHCAITGFHRHWKRLMKLRYEERKPWAEVEDKLGITAEERAVTIRIIRRELRIDLAVAKCHIPEGA